MNLGPGLEGLGSGGSALTGRTVITAKVEEVVDLVVGGQKVLSGSGKSFFYATGGELLDGRRADLKRFVCRSRRLVG